MTDNRIKQIADANGKETILNKLTEECGELITAIARAQSKLYNEHYYPEEYYQDMIEEAADTMIMIEQLRLQSADLFDRLKETKIERQCERMNIPYKPQQSELQELAYQNEKLKQALAECAGY